jgi:hypothetical protein
MPDSDQPDVVSLRECFVNQRACRKELFDHSDKNQKVVVDRLDAIDKKLAYLRGRADGASALSLNEPVNGVRMPTIKEIIRVGVVIGALVGGTFAGCQGAKMALQKPASANTGE